MCTIHVEIALIHKPKFRAESKRVDIDIVTNQCIVRLGLLFSLVSLFGAFPLMFTLKKSRADVAVQ